MSRRAGVILTAVLSLLGHLTLGWMAVIPAAAIGGGLSLGRGWFVGMAGVLLAWAGVVIFSYVIAPGPAAEMTRSIGLLAGGLPSAAIPVATLTVAALLGAAAGWLGESVATIIT